MDHKHLAERAIATYPVHIDSMDYIAQSGAIVYKVIDKSGDSYSLRLYSSVNNALGDEWTSKSAIRSMLQWMNALAKDKCEITIPNPVLNNSGELITSIDGINCTLEKWLKGEQKPYFMTKQDASSVGILLARLHEHATVWKLPDGFERPQFTSDCITETLSALKETSLVFTDDCIQALETGAVKAMNLLDTYERNNKTWGIIHADIIPPNLLYYKNEIQLIDFGACGFGYYMWDVATTMPFVPMHLRKVLLDAYASVYPLPDNYIEIIEGFFVACRLQVLGFFVHLPDAAAWVPNEYEKFSQRELFRYLQGKSFLFEGTPYYE